MMENENSQNNPNYFRLYLERRGIIPNSLYIYICHEWEDAKLGKPPTAQTVVNWVNANVCWQLTPDRWQAIARILNLTIDNVKVLMSGRIGCKIYSQEEIDRVITGRLPITDPNFTLRYLIKNAGLTQKAFAVKVGASLTAVQEWCAGKHEPNLTPRQNCMAVKALKCTPEEFMIATENARPARLSIVREKKLEKTA